MIRPPSTVAEAVMRAPISVGVTLGSPSSCAPPGAPDALPPRPRGSDREREEEHRERGGLTARVVDPHEPEARPDSGQAEHADAFEPAPQSDDPDHGDHAEHEQEHQE